MAESCSSPNINNINASASSLNAEGDITKADCTSPSPTETVCLESLCTDINIPGPSHDTLAPVKDKLNELSQLNHTEIVCEEKDSFLNKLGLDKVEECLDGDVNNGENGCFNTHECEEDAWEDCMEDPEVDEHRNSNQEVADNEVSAVFVFYQYLCTYNSA